jgi:aspartokinase
LKRNGDQVAVLKDMAIVSVIGSEMRNMIGMAGRMFTCLAGAGVNIEMISQGARLLGLFMRNVFLGCQWRNRSRYLTFSSVKE